MKKSFFINSTWMLAEQLSKIFSGLFVGIYVARHIGPENFGILSLCIAVVTIFMVFARLGMETIVVREILKKTEYKNKIVSTAFALMLVSGVICSVIIFTASLFVFEDRSVLVYLWIVSLGLIFQAFLVIDFEFQADLNAKIGSAAKIIATILSGLLKIGLVIIDADLVYFAIAYLCDIAFIAIFLVLSRVLNGGISLEAPARNTAVVLLKYSWPFVLSGLSMNLYSNIDKLMIGYYYSAVEVGVYSAATKIYEGWVLIPWIITISSLPYILRLKKQSEKVYIDTLKKINFYVFWAIVIVAAILTYFNDEIIAITFGLEYASGADVLAILIWASIFNFYIFLSSRYFTVEGKERKIPLRTLSALVINVILNMILIPVMGIIGAAWSTLISLFVAGYLIDLLDKESFLLFGVKNSFLNVRGLKSEKSSNH